MGRWEDLTAQYGIPTWDNGYWTWESGHWFTSNETMEDQSINSYPTRNQIEAFRTSFLNPQLTAAGLYAIQQGGIVSSTCGAAKKLRGKTKTYAETAMLERILMACAYDKVQPALPTSQPILPIPSASEYKQAAAAAANQATPQLSVSTNASSLTKDPMVWLLGAVALMLILSGGQRSPERVRDR